MRVLKQPIQVRGYDMYDMFKIRGLLAFDRESRIMRVACSYGYKEDDGDFKPSEFKDHSIVINIEGDEFDKINMRIRKDDQGNIWSIIEERLYEYIQDTRNLFRE